MFDISLYTVGWICAITTEYVAAQQFLDERHDTAEYEAQRDDNNDYTFGRIGKHSVVIAVLPNGEYGTNSAAVVVRDMVRSFPNLKIGLMVGIGGGAPLVSPASEGNQVDLKHDVRLGDIVVSSPGNGQGGVYQYDYGKAIQNRKFHQTGHLNSPPSFLLGAIAGLRAQIEVDGHTIDKDVRKILDSKPRLQLKYSRPDKESDRLYRSTCLHPSDSDKSCVQVCSNNNDDIVLRVPRSEIDDDPTIHYGLIASANSLMKDATARDALAKEKGVLCFEMEAAGLMNQFPFLVIRGICDYADSHKNKEWQGYAAMAAAAYAKKLLYKVAPTKVDTEKRLHEVQQIRESLQEGV